MPPKEEIQPTALSPWLETNASQLPHGKLVAKIQAENFAEKGEKLDRSKFMEINVDRRQQAFHDGKNPGGLPVDLGAAVDTYASVTDSKLDWGAVIDTIDWHNKKNLSLVSNYPGFSPFSSLTLKDGAVMYNEGPNSVPYQEKVGENTKDYPTESVLKNYLEKKLIFRTFIALMFDDQVTGTEQTLWPEHATDSNDELGYLQGLISAGQLPDVVALKGGEAIHQLEKKQDSWKPDSYSAIFDAEGNIVKTVMFGGQKIVEYSTGHAIEDLMKESFLEGIVLNGIAFTHCVKDTAEGLRLMQKMHEYKNKPDDLKAKFNARSNEFTGVQWEQIKALFDYYIKYDMTLDPKYIIAVNVERTAPVQLPGPEMASVNQQIEDAAEQGYRKMGIRLTTDRDLK